MIISVCLCRCLSLFMVKSMDRCQDKQLCEYILPGNYIGVSNEFFVVFSLGFVT
jgi:hypothetical protein